VIGINKTSRVQTKFDARAMYLVSIDPVREGYTLEKAQALAAKIPERLKTAGTVRRVALAAQTPFSIKDEDETTQLTSEGPASRVQIPGFEETVGAGYFAALSEPVVAGREFTELDQQSQADGSKILPAVLNESASRGFFGSGNPIGQRVKDDKQSYEVIGVVPDFESGVGIASQAVIYLPLTQRVFARPPADGITIMVLSDVGADTLSSIRREIAIVDPNLTIFNVQTLGAYLDRSRSYTRFSVQKYGGMGVFGLVLAAIGLAGVTAYAVAQRRKEIGIRMALGARKGQVLQLVLREGAALVSVGTLLGFLGAVALAKVLSALTHVFVDALKVGTNDPRLLLGAPLLLAGLALLACYVPARRAAKIDPLKALREE
jgi:hypothetical protein